MEQCTRKSAQPNNIGLAEVHIDANVAAASLAASSSEPAAAVVQAPFGSAAPLTNTVSASKFEPVVAFSFDFSRFSSAAELESIGAESLKSALTSAGLKCGGTLSQRAERLFLLKTTPRSELSKKHFAH